MPRLEGRAEAEREQSPCEQAMSLAQPSTQPDMTLPQSVRYLQLREAPLAWIDAASSCPARFSEGVMRNALTKYQVSKLASKFADNAPSTTPARLDGVKSLDIDGTILTKLALEEDKAGFAVEILAARGVSGATLTLSDDHKTAAQQLVSLANGADDLREKTYSIEHLNTDSQVDDKASGQQVPVLAAIEMDCARNELAAIGQTTANSDTLGILAALIAKHAYTALQLGYPASDTAIFS